MNIFHIIREECLSYYKVIIFHQLHPNALIKAICFLPPFLIVFAYRLIKILKIYIKTKKALHYIFR